MITILIGIIVGLLVIAVIMLLVHRPSTSAAGAGAGTAPAPTTPATAPAPTPAPARVTTVVTPCPTQGSDWLGGIGRFMWGLVKVVFSIAIVLAILGGLYFGGLWAKNGIDRWARQSDCGKKELVIIRPGLHTTIDINGFTKWSLMPPVSTLVEYLDQWGNPIPVECNGVLAYSIVSQPGINYPVRSGSDLRFLRMSSADPASVEYSFVIKLE
ncbi:MAG: hypothetical protein WCJ74_02215 [bacterium]